jgi:hypothetical protein
MDDVSTEASSDTRDAYVQLISEIDSMLVTTRNKVDAALRLSTDDPRQLRALAKLDNMLAAPMQYSRRLRAGS